MTNSRARSLHFQKVKPVDEIVNNSTTIQNDDALTTKLGIGTYFVEVDIFLTSSATPDFKYSMDGTGATGSYSNSALSSGVPSAVTAMGVAVLITTDGNTQHLQINATVVMTQQATFSFQWAQQTQTVADTKVLKGSCIRIYKV